MISWRVYRVVVITDEHNRDSLNSPFHPDFIMSTSAPSYCTPGIAFWLSESGIEDPAAECVLIETSAPSNDDISPFLQYPVEFEYDHGRYRGMLMAEEQQKIVVSKEKKSRTGSYVRWASDAIVRDISSL